MIRNIILYAFTALLAGNTLTAAGRQTADSLSIDWSDSTRLVLGFKIHAGDATIKSNYRLIAMPRIVGEEGQTLDMPPVEFSGKKARKYFNRREVLDKTYSGRPVYAPGDTVDYSYTATVEPWMKEGKIRIVVDRDMEDCCDVTQLSPLAVGAARFFVPKPHIVVPKISVAEQIAEREPVLVPMSEYRPFNPDIPLRKMKNALYVHFPVNKWNIDEGFRSNRETLGRILDMMGRIEKDTLSAVVKVRIIGLSSPEGPLAFNNQLSYNRAQSLKDYLVEHGFHMPDSAFEIIAGGEAWADLKDVVAESDLPLKEELISIIDNTEDLNRREALIRKHNGGKSFDYLRQSVFADQRNSGYIQMYYEAVVDTAALAINRAVELINEGRAAEAVALIEPLNDNRKWNALGAAYYFCGRHRDAYEAFSKAVEQGNEGAVENMNAIREVLELQNP